MNEQFLDTKGGTRFLPPGRRTVPRTSVYGICEADGKILLSKPTYSDNWELPGGKVERGEELISALRREVEEETGYTVPDQTFLLLNERQENFYIESADEYYDSKLFFFRLEKIGEQQQDLIHRDEVSAVAWIPLAKMNESNMQRNAWWAVCNLLLAAKGAQ